MKIYHNPRCNTSRTTLGILRDAGKTPEVIEYLKDTPTKEELTEIVRKLGIPAEDLLRKTESLYKEKHKGSEHTDEEWIDLMLANPILIQRPIVIDGDKAVLSRPAEKVKEIL